MTDTPMIDTQHEADLAHEPVEQGTAFPWWAVFKRELGTYFRSPIAYAAVKPADYEGLLVPGGHAPGMKTLLESTVAQSVSAGVGGAPAQAAEESSVTSTSLGVPVVGVALLAGLVVAAAAWLRRRAAGRGRHASYSSGA